MDPSPRRPHSPMPPDATATPQQIGNYDLIAKIAEGGMGAVYKARHVELGKVVALKVLPAGDFSEVSLARFKNEMRAIGPEPRGPVGRGRRSTGGRTGARRSG